MQLHQLFFAAFFATTALSSATYANGDSGANTGGVNLQYGINNSKNVITRGLNNTIEILQGDAGAKFGYAFYAKDSSVDVTQVGNNNSVVAGSINTIGDSLTFRQFGSNSSATIYSRSNFADLSDPAQPPKNTYVIQQVGNGIKSASINSSPGIIDPEGEHISLSSVGNEATIMQNIKDAESASAEIGIQGDFNLATIDQRAGGANKSARIEQLEGSYNNARIIQSNDNHANIKQLGSWNIAFITQEGRNGRAQTTQTGDNNFAHIIDNGSSNVANITQQKHVYSYDEVTGASVLDSSQPVHGNAAKINLTRTSRDNDISVYQASDNNQVNLHVSGQSNIVRVSQYGVANRLGSLQPSADLDAPLNIAGRNHNIEINMINGANGAGVKLNAQRPQRASQPTVLNLIGQ